MTASIIHTQWSFGILVFHRTKCLWCLLAPPENEERVSKSIINNAGIQKQDFSLSSTRGGSYLFFVKNTLASLNSLCLQSLCLYESNKPQTFLCERSSEHSTNRHYAQECNVSIVTAVIARLSTSWRDVLSWCDSRVIVSDLSNRSLIFFKVLPSAMLTWGWQGLGFNPGSWSAAGGANEPNLQSDKRRDSQQTPRWCYLLFYPTYRLNM